MGALTTTGVALVPQNMNEAITLADRMARAKLVPAALQNSPGDCLLVIEQAMRWGMSPFAVAQEVSVIQGKLMHSGKIVAAAINSSGVLAGRLQYNYAGVGDERTITVTGTLRGESQERSISVVFRDAATNNPHWKKQGDQQLAYYGSRVWARRYVPEVMLGVYAPEEFGTDEAPNTIDGHSEPASKTVMQKASQVARAQDIITNGRGPTNGSDDNSGRQDTPDMTVPGLEKGAATWIEEFAKVKGEPRLAVLEEGVIRLLEALSEAGLHKLRGDVAKAMSDARKRIVPPVDPITLEGALPPAAGGMGK